MYRVLTAILAILTTSIAFALDSEYKNALNNIDINKSSDSSYSINLYTAKEFSEPIKVIKKSDLNYYILLPETKNASPKALVNNPDIRSIETQSFPYAGSDVKNGYTKININTTKPINFTVNTKTKIASAPQKAASLKETKEEAKAVVSDTKVQKKNLVQETKNTKNNVNSGVQTVKSDAKKETKPDKKENNVSPKKETRTQNIPGFKKLPVKAEHKKQEQKKPEVKKEEVVSDKKETEQERQLDKATKEEELQKPIQEETEQEEMQSSENSELEAENITNEEEGENIQPENKQEIQKKNIIAEIKSSIKFNLEILKYKVRSKLLEYGLNLKELLLMTVVGILSLVIIFLILTKNRETNTRLKSKSDFIDKNGKKNPTLTPRKKPAKNQGQRFIFDKSIHPTGFIAPATGERRNFELSSYEPSLKKKTTATIEPYQATHKTSEYDIIQNILREDTFIELTDEEVEKNKEHTNPLTTSVVEVPKIPEPQKEINAVQDSKEPMVLSSVEIAPQRGFMCVSYNNSINVLGYIFDDVFALYNFQQPKLENYNIRFRLSEKTKYGANFILKIDKTKLLVSVTKSSMSLEVAF